MPEKKSKTSAKEEVKTTKIPPKTSLAKTSRSSPKSSQAKKKNLRKLTPEEQYRNINETAYYIAERRGFNNGSCEDDWYEAEKIVLSSLIPE